MKLAIVASNATAAQQAAQALSQMYTNYSLSEADVIVALGGDGFMLRTLHQHMHLNKPVYGMRRGHIGFLMNQHVEPHLPERIEQAHAAVLRPLEMRVTTVDGDVYTARAFNEVSMLRQSNQASHVGIDLNGKTKLDTLICDGVMVATPAGSTAYNFSAHGPILPLDANVLALTPISPFRPRRWRGAILPHTTEVSFRVQNPEKRPVSTTADFLEVRDVARVDIRQLQDVAVQLLFDPEHNLEERILDEQFAL